MSQKILRIFLILALTLSFSPGVLAQEDQPERAFPESLDDLKLDSPITVEGVTPVSKLDRGLLSAQGLQQVVVRLKEEPVARTAARGQDLGEQKSQLGRIQAQ